MATFVRPILKNIFREDLNNDDNEVIWNEFAFNDETITLGNFYIPPKDYDHLLQVDNQLLKVNNPIAIILGDFNCRNQLWEDSARFNSRVGKKLE